jgi:hypothetical protein
MESDAPHEHHWHYNENGEVKSSNPCWYSVRCCKCLKGNFVKADGFDCVRTSYLAGWNDMGPHLEGTVLS